jgi:hypothetical protein
VTTALSHTNQSSYHHQASIDCDADSAESHVVGGNGHCSNGGATQADIDHALQQPYNKRLEVGMDLMLV